MIASVAVLTGCLTDNIEIPAPPAASEPSLEIVISRNGFASTRASGTEFTKAEKKIVSVDLFFFADNATDASKPLHYVRTVPVMSTEAATSNTGTINTSIPVKDIFDDTHTTCRVYAAVNTDATKERRDLTLGELKNLKATTAKFAVGQLHDEDAEDLDKFEGFVMFTSSETGDVVTYNSAERKATGKVIVNKLASKIDLYLGFGPDGGENVTITAPDPNKPEGPVYEWEVYREEDDAVEVFIVNGVQSVRLGGYNGLDFLASEDYFDFRQEGMRKYARGFKESNAEDKARYPFLVESPFYTYPTEWNTDVLEQRRTSLLLKVNWLPKGGDVTKDLLETYYMVPLNVEGYIDEGTENRILSNKYYRVKVRVNTLGGQHFGQPLVLDECSYEILPWGSAKLDAILRDTRYLEVRQQVEDRDGSLYTAIMNNVNTITIPMNSSHKVKVKDVKIEYTDFTNYITYVAPHNRGGDEQSTVYQYPGETKYNNVGSSFTLAAEDLKNESYQGIYIDDIAQTITMRHDVGIMYSSGGHYLVDKNIKYQYSPYIITITLDHSDGLLDEPETITIKQYPPIYIEAEINATINSVNFIAGSGRDVNFDRYVVVSQQHFFGFARINGNSYGNDAPWGGLNGIAKAGRSTGEADNPIMYTISATQFNADSQYHLADPRCNYSNTDLNGEVLIDDTRKTGSGWTSARHIDGGTTTLTWYYPTKEDLTDNARWAVSPKFRVASAVSSIYTPVWPFTPDYMTKQNARMRCASYCEYGFPAGRWRMPTLGEFYIIKEMADNGVIPKLFADNTVYFTAQGPYYVENGTIKEASGDMGGKKGTSTTGTVRCVYDDWYWVKADGTPDRVYPNYVNTTTNTYDFSNLYNGGQIFFWGDRERKSPQDQETE